MQKHSSSTYSTLSAGLLWTLLVLSPLFVWPTFSDFFNFSKYLLIVVVALAIIVAYAFNSVRHGSLQVAFSSISGALGLFLLSVLASTFLSTRYPVENLLNMGGVYLAMVAIIIFGSTLLQKKEVAHFPLFLSASGVLLTVFTVLQTLGAGPSLVLNSVFGLQIPDTNLFNLAGSPFLATQWLGLSIVSLVAWVVITKQLPKYLLGALPVMALGLILNGWSVLPGKPAEPILLSPAASWSVALDTLRSPRSAIIGVGIDNYEAAFVQFKPAWLNSTEQWNIAFTQGSNTPFTLLTTAGFFGLIGWLSLVWVVWRQFKAREKADPVTKSLIITALLGFGLQLLVAPSIVMVAWQTVVLTLIAVATRKKELFINPFAVTVADQAQPWVDTTHRLPGSRYLVAAVCMLLVLTSGYGLFRGTAAGYQAFAAAMAVQTGSFADVYQLQQNAISWNPYLDTYRQQYALINIQIAAALANKTDITEEEKTQISELIQQAIREARAATTLNPERSANWLVLARIYSQLIGVATDADQWTVSAYAQAIQTAPTDASLRLELGGLFYSQENFPQALSLFEQAIQLKPDYANGYYNAANTLVRLEDLAGAKLAYERTLQLLPDTTSEAYQLAQSELDQVNAELTKVESMNADAEQADLGTTPTQPVTEASDSAETPLSILDETVNDAGQDIVNP